MKLLPFNLEAVKNGASIVLRNGDPVKFIAHVPEANTSSQLIILNASAVMVYRADGKYYNHTESSLDLFITPKQFTKWINIYPDSNQSYLHDSKITAAEHGHGGKGECCIARIPVTFYEGEGLD